MRLQLRHRPGRHDAAQHAAFADLHREHARGVYNLALGLVGDAEEARDISQDVLLKAFQRLGKPGEVHYRAWLYRVTVNACYDHLRRIRRRPLAAAAQPEPVSPVDGFEQADLASAVETALRRLPPAQRAALLLREIHGLRTGEVAYALGTTPDSAAVTLSRARKTFRRHFEDLTSKASVLAAGLSLPRLHLPQAPLPAGLESSALLSAASTGVGMSVGHNADATVGIVARLADALCSKAGAVGATATLVTGSIGGAYAVEHAARDARPFPPPSSRQATSTATPGAGPSVSPRPVPSTPAPTPAAVAVSPATGAPTASPSPAATTPSSAPTALTVGETGEAASPTPQPTSSAEPSTAPSATPSPAASPEPTASPSGWPTPQASPTASP
ncbi:MAG: sigma-70 family RNA polymerase sigma factor [Solirubrobacteraceae bacterium]